MTARAKRIEAPPVVVVPTAKPRGFAAMSAERRKQVASMGGRTSQGKGTAHVFTSEDAPVYGRQGADVRWHGKKRAMKIEKVKDE